MQLTNDVSSFFTMFNFVTDQLANCFQLKILCGKVNFL